MENRNDDVIVPCCCWQKCRKSKKRGARKTKMQRERDATWKRDNAWEARRRMCKRRKTHNAKPLLPDLRRTVSSREESGGPRMCALSTPLCRVTGCNILQHQRAARPQIILRSLIALKHEQPVNGRRNLISVMMARL